ncbi:MAG: helix-turn-helix domain-containing protein [Myxococcota bacterium]
MSFFLPAASLSDFDGRSRRYALGRCFCYWQDGARANGTFLWGKPLENDIADMEPYWSIGAGDRAWDGRAGFIDARGVAGIDALGFRRLLSYLMRTQHSLRGVGSVTMVHGGGLVGVVTAGLLSVVRPPYPFFAVGVEQLREGFARVGVADLYEPTEDLYRRVGEAPEIVSTVQAVLHQHPQATTEELADHLGLSARTLQRRLDAAGTSLREVRQQHLLRQAEELLAATTLDLDAIAAQLGLSSASHLVQHFRRVHAMTPGEWRARNRR